MADSENKKTQDEPKKSDDQNLSSIQSKDIKVKKVYTKQIIIGAAIALILVATVVGAVLYRNSEDKIPPKQTAVQTETEEIFILNYSKYERKQLLDSAETKYPKNMYESAAYAEYESALAEIKKDVKYLESGETAEKETVYVPPQEKWYWEVGSNADGGQWKKIPVNPVQTETEEETKKPEPETEIRMKVPNEAYMIFEKAKEKLKNSLTCDYNTIIIEDAPDSLTHNYTDVTVDVIYKGKQTHSDAKISLRGNSTAMAEKTPYNIKFDSSTGLFGMASGKKWCLLAEMYDKTLMRNKLAFDFGREIGLDTTSECEYCDVWYNGRYMGVYLAAEPVGDGKNRVDIDTDAGEFIVEQFYNGDWDFDLPSGVPFRYKDPSAPSVEEKTEIEKLMTKVDEAIITADMSNYGQLIDVDSFVNTYIEMELFKDVDAGISSMFYYYKNGKLYCSPPWDFDLSTGNVSYVEGYPGFIRYMNMDGMGDGSGDSTHGFSMTTFWFYHLTKDKQFLDKVKKRYLEIRPLITNLYTDTENGKNKIDTIVEANKKHFNLNYSEEGAGWDIAKQYTIMAAEPESSYSGNVEVLRKWLKHRDEWLFENIGKAQKK